MFNSIQQFETAGIKNLRKAEDEFIRTRGMANFINAIKEVVLHLGLDVIAETPENYDAAIRKSPKRSEKWSVVRKDPKQLVTSLGTVQYRKTLFINKTTKERSYLLDRELGLEKHQRITEDAEAQLLTEAVQTTYRKGGEAVPHPASTQASRQTVSHANTLFTVPTSLAFLAESLCRIVRLFFGFGGFFRFGIPEYFHPFKPDRHTGLSVDGAGKQRQIPVPCFHPLRVHGVQRLPLHHLEGHHMLIHICKQDDVPGLELLQLSEMGRIVVGADDQVVLIQRA